MIGQGPSYFTQIPALSDGALPLRLDLPGSHPIFSGLLQKPVAITRSVAPEVWAPYSTFSAPWSCAPRPLGCAAPARAVVAEALLLHRGGSSQSARTAAQILAE